jgi:hypothetical protein
MKNMGVLMPIKEAPSNYSSFCNSASSLVKCPFFWGCEPEPLIISRRLKKRSPEILGTKYLVTQRLIT